MIARRLPCVLLVVLCCGCDGCAPAARELDGATPTTRDGSIGGGARDAALDARALDASSPADAGAPGADARAGAVPGEAGAGSEAAVRSPRSAGCGKSASASNGFASRTLRVGDRDRTYALRVPEGYQPGRAYPLVFRFHGSGGNGESGGLDIERATDDGALIVAPDGLNQNWTNETADLALFDALLAELGAQYCVDLERVYAYGFSAGAGFSELLACKRGNQLRAIGAVAGWDRTRGASCQRPVAAWLAHDLDDEAVTIEMGRAGRDQLLQLNGCSNQTMPSGDCVRYQGCAAPVVWCETTGLGHNIRGDYAPEQVWAFFSSL
jgi:polyhydroxybutyrate depolymerase